MKITVTDIRQRRKHLNLKRVDGVSYGLIIDWQLVDVVNLKDTWKMIFLPHKSPDSYKIASFLGDRIDEQWSDTETKEERKWIEKNKPRYLRKKGCITIPKTTYSSPN